VERRAVDDIKGFCWKCERAAVLAKPDVVDRRWRYCCRLGIYRFAWTPGLWLRS
jgi:hypothetical protein